MDMTNQTLELMHNAYEKALCSSSSIVGTIRRLKEYLEDNRAIVPPEDIISFDAFLGGLDACYHYRQNTSDITVMVTYLSITILAIVKYLGSKKDFRNLLIYLEQIEDEKKNLFVDVIAGRKSLESDLTKCLGRSIETPEITSVNGDFFGLTIVLLNEKDFVEPRDTVRLLSREITKILGGQDGGLRQDFMEWVKSNYSKISLPAIEATMTIPFAVVNVEEFDKSNGYHSIHTDMETKSYTPYDSLKGIPVEFHYQTYTDFFNSLFGEAAHWRYKSELDERLSSVFCLKDYSQTRIPGLNNLLDIDGVKKADDKRKSVATRRSQMYD